MNALTVKSDLLSTSPLDRPLHVSFIKDKHARSIHSSYMSLRELAPKITEKHAPSKARLPWLKLAAFGAVASENGSLRSNANVLSVDGIEGDYDAEIVFPPHAVRALEAAGIAGLVYTSPSHTFEKPRWRVLCPLSRTHQPQDRDGLVARLNTVLEGCLARESFTLSQSYYFGYVDGADDHACYFAEGEFIDLVPLEPTYPPGGTTLNLPVILQQETPDATAEAALQAAADLFTTLMCEGPHQIVLAATALVAPFVLSGHLAQQRSRRN